MEQENQRLALISAILGEKARSSRAFTQYMMKEQEYEAGETLFMREAHFLLALGPGKGKTMSQLAQALEVTQGAVSQTAGRLEQKGYIRREPSPGDRRQILAALTEKGRAFYNRHLEFDRAAFLKMDAEHLSRFSLEELRLCFEYERQMTAIFSPTGETDPPKKEGWEHHEF